METYKKIVIVVTDDRNALEYSNATITVESDIAIGIQRTSRYYEGQVTTFIPWSRIVRIDCVK